MRVLIHGFYDKKPSNIEDFQELVVFMSKELTISCRAWVILSVLYDEVLYP